MKKKPVSQGIAIKKKYGQHFLRDYSVVQGMLDAVHLDTATSVFEIGCGDGFLTDQIIQTDIARLWVFEIDHEWVDYIEKRIQDDRLTVYNENILDVDYSIFEPHKPWTLLANLPYQITFPILHRLQEHRHLFKEGVIMVQEEVAQKIVKTRGRGYGFASLFYQYFFEWKLLTKIPPSAFEPPPKVLSRLMYFKTKKDLIEIPDQDRFWKFIKICFKQPRRTLRNNFAQVQFDFSVFPDELLGMRAQQLSMDDFLKLWDQVR